MRVRDSSKDGATPVAPFTHALSLSPSPQPCASTAPAHPCLQLHRQQLTPTRREPPASLSTHLLPPTPSPAALSTPTCAYPSCYSLPPTTLVLTPILRCSPSLPVTFNLLPASTTASNGTGGRSINTSTFTQTQNYAKILYLGVFCHRVFEGKVNI